MMQPHSWRKRVVRIALGEAYLLRKRVVRRWHLRLVLRDGGNDVFEIR